MLSTIVHTVLPRVNITSDNRVQVMILTDIFFSIKIDVRTISIELVLKKCLSRNNTLIYILSPTETDLIVSCLDTLCYCGLQK